MIMIPVRERKTGIEEGKFEEARILDHNFLSGKCLSFAGITMQVLAEMFAVYH